LTGSRGFGDGDGSGGRGNGQESHFREISASQVYHSYGLADSGSLEKRLIQLGKRAFSMTRRLGSSTPLTVQFYQIASNPVRNDKFYSWCTVRRHLDRIYRPTSTHNWCSPQPLFRPVIHGNPLPGRLPYSPLLRPVNTPIQLKTPTLRPTAIGVPIECHRHRIRLRSAGPQFRR
jgi:hypothetical protein